MKPVAPVLLVIVVAPTGAISYLLWGQSDPCATQKALEREYTFVLGPSDQGYEVPPEPPQPPIEVRFVPIAERETKFVPPHKRFPWFDENLTQEEVIAINQQSQRTYQLALQEHSKVVEDANNQRAFLVERMSEPVRRRYDTASFSCLRSFRD